jgi:hypothetical protein
VVLLLQINFHLADGGLAVLFLGDFLELAAAGGGDLADETEVAALKLPGGELLGRNGCARPAASAATRRGYRRCGLGWGRRCTG